MHTRFGGEIWGERSYLEDPGLDGRITLNGSSRTAMEGCGLDLCGSGQGQVVGSCECGNELSGSVKCGEFLD